MSNPDTIRAEIEATRANLAVDVDALADKVSPTQIAERQKERVKGRLRSMQETVMGPVHDVRDAAEAVGDHVAGATDSTKAAVADAASGVSEKAQGHPLVVGLIAFGAGWLLSSLLPSTEGEQRLAASAKEKAEPLIEKVQDVAKDAGQEVAQHLKEPAQEAAQNVKESATDAAQTIQREARDAGEQVSAQAQDAKSNIQDSAQGAKEDLQHQAQNPQ
jgi:hypothetical protein